MPGREEGFLREAEMLRTWRGLFLAGLSAISIAFAPAIAQTDDPPPDARAVFVGSGYAPRDGQVVYDIGWQDQNGGGGPPGR